MDGRKLIIWNRENSQFEIPMEYWKRKAVTVLEINTFKMYHRMKLQTVDIEMKFKNIFQSVILWTGKCF